MKTPIEVFSDWVDIGKDEGMEKNHYMPVMEMIKLYNVGNAYSFVDAGCGNGWLVRYLFENTNCVNGIGVDGSKKMIKKARLLDNLGTYFNADLLSWNPEDKVNVVFSMEVLYYFENPQTLINKIHDNKKQLKPIKANTNDSEDISYSSNIIKDVNYSSKDSKGNEYIINALQGEIDYSNPDIVYLTNVSALVRLQNANIIRITSNYGKYNINNFDTIFSKNVLITYLDNKIKSEYLDFSIKRNSMLISKDVIYTNSENSLRADVVEINIETKDTKIFMYENNKKINIKSNK